MEVIGEETSKKGKTDVVMGTGDSPVRRAKDSDSHFEDYPGDTFEKVGEIDLEETPQTPS